MMGTSHSRSNNSDIFERFAYDTTKKYGEGGYGATYRAQEKATGTPLAVKIIDTRRMRQDAILKECQILEVLTHPSVISVKGHGKGSGAQQHLYFIFMELAGGGELFDQVIDRGANAMPEAVARTFFCQMLDGVAYCHLAGVAHRDLKLENVLLNEQGHLKLIDFGLSHVYPRHSDGTIDRSKSLHDVCGSKSYAAPEVLGGRGYDGFAADMWSLGVCLFAMLSGFFPLDEAAPNDWRFPKLVQAQAEKRSTTEAIYVWYKRSARHLSREVVHLLDSLLTINPAQRMTMGEAREHAWVKAVKFGGALPSDQGSFNHNDMLDNDELRYRGVGAGYELSEGMMIEDETDDMPVYRSLGGMGDEDFAAAAAAGPAPAMPMLGRQKARMNLLDPIELDSVGPA